MKLDDPGLENELVSLKVLTEADRDVLASTSAVEAMWQWMPVIATGTNFHSYFDDTLEMKKSGNYIPFTIWRKSDGAFAGVVAYADISRTHRRLRMASLWIVEEMRGTAIVPAVQLATIERAVASRMRRIEILTPVSNERSVRSIERFGARREGTLRSYFRMANGSWADMAILSLVGEEANAAMALLQDRVRVLQQA
ncbi:GNAT family protein [uncultured Hyphomonas sp.]|uniref:GNAT family N-acetyltransferase n=1 Tax=uncultured Hyphomonas sp. TaxID=225298 RepID=UPI002AAAEA93|nr:GNAT family protein [uncultured Hyphomonas sp.]